jgi:hypothetical protein
MVEIISHVDAHAMHVHAVIHGEQALESNSYCSPKCICCYSDDKINNDIIMKQRKFLAGSTKSDMCFLARYNEKSFLGESQANDLMTYQKMK